MDWFPLFNSMRIALISTGITFFSGIFIAYLVCSLPKKIRGFLDCVLMLPLVLPPTVVGFFLLKSLSPNSALGKIFINAFDTKLIMTWYASIFAVSVIIFPLMYRTARGAFESIDENLIYAGKTLGLSENFIFWKIIIPCSKKGLLAGAVLSFARALGEYGATSMVSGYIPGKTAAVSTTVYQLWRQGEDVLAYKWIFINIVISLAVLTAMNLIEKKSGRSLYK